MSSPLHSVVCPSCQFTNEDATETCFKCGKNLFVVMEGTLLAGRYEILKPLGRGGMGVVYKAKDRELDEIVALKVLRPEIARSVDMVRRFRGEIKLARKIRHRNVCGIHEFGQDGHLQFIAMELIEGVDLKKVLREKGPLPVDQAYEVSMQVAKGLQAIHDAGVVHRDLKTPNLMRDPTGLVRLMDFGIAKDARTDSADHTATGQIIGTPEYMSPEQARGERVDHRSDIYALAIVMWELFTGDVPFRGDSPLATLYKHLHDPPPVDGPGSARLPGPLRPVLQKAMAKRPEDRYQSVRELGDALRNARVASGVTGISGALPVVPRSPAATTAAPSDETTAIPTTGPFGATTAVPDDETWIEEQPPSPTAPALTVSAGGLTAAPPTVRRTLPAGRESRPAPPPRRAWWGVAAVSAIAVVAVVAWRFWPPAPVVGTPPPPVSVAPATRPPRPPRRPRRLRRRPRSLPSPRRPARPRHRLDGHSRARRPDSGGGPGGRALPGPAQRHPADTAAGVSRPRSDDHVAGGPGHTGPRNSRAHSGRRAAPLELRGRGPSCARILRSRLREPRPQGDQGRLPFHLEGRPRPPAPLQGLRHGDRADPHRHRRPEGARPQPAEGGIEGVHGQGAHAGPARGDIHARVPEWLLGAHRVAGGTEPLAYTFADT
jgi:serine/threonine protein kinase